MRTRRCWFHFSTALSAVCAMLVAGECSAAQNLYAALGLAVYEYTPAGQRSTFVNIAGEPTDLVFDNAGNLFVSDQSTNNCIYKITPNGTIKIFAAGLGRPEGIALDSSGNVFVAEHDANRICL